MPTMVGLHCTLFIPTSVSLGCFLVGMAVLNAKVAV